MSEEDVLARVDAAVADYHVVGEPVGFTACGLAWDWSRHPGPGGPATRVARDGKPVHGVVSGTVLRTRVACPRCVGP